MARSRPSVCSRMNNRNRGSQDNLAAVATTIDQRLSVAFRTHEQPGRRRGAATGSGGHPGDERHDCRNTDAACVPSSVWSTASERNRQVRSAPCLARNTGKPSTRGPAPRRPSIRPHIASATEDVHSATAAELSIHCSPSIRGFPPPSTVLAAIGAERKLRQLKPSGADPPAQIPEPRATPPGAVRYRALPARSTQDRSVSGR